VKVAGGWCRWVKVSGLASTTCPNLPPRCLTVPRSPCRRSAGTWRPPCRRR
jgi:hypothetical protein